MGNSVVSIQHSGFRFFLKSAISHQPSAISHQPSTINHQPSTISHQPSAISTLRHPLLPITYILA
ncbi:hypothetical protein EP331_05500 [bacterium]|nr:MAG: hypothetical protein EP331_05500 [bacterium]